jgi:hypothetical protein
VRVLLIRYLICLSVIAVISCRLNESKELGKTTPGDANLTSIDASTIRSDSDVTYIEGSKGNIESGYMSSDAVAAGEESDGPTRVLDAMSEYDVCPRVIVNLNESNQAEDGQVASLSCQVQLERLLDAIITVFRSNVWKTMIVELTDFSGKTQIIPNVLSEADCRSVRAWFLAKDANEVRFCPALCEEIKEYKTVVVRIACLDLPL